MSFIDDIVDTGSSVIKFFSGDSLASTLAKTALTGLALNQITKSINKSNNTATVDKGSLQTISASTDNSIPVLYGKAYVNPNIIDVKMSADNQTMWYCLTLCEQTGTLLSNNQPSVISFEEIYWNDVLVNFADDGITVSKFSATDGSVDTSPAGLIKIYCFSGGSQKPVNVKGYTLSNQIYAYNIIPEWTPSHSMDNLIFAIIRVDYNKEKNNTGLGNIQFKLSNTMKLPGDCLYDYMTNTRYGAGIPPEEINS